MFVFVDDAVTGILPDIPKLTLIQCNSAYWAQNGIDRPERRVRRQSFNANLAREQYCRTVWIGHIDLDEFIHLRDGTSMSELLEAIPASFPAARLRPAERMFLSRSDAISGSYDGFYKIHGKGADIAAHIYDADLTALVPAGLQGHLQGKSFARTAAGGRLSIHRLKQGGKPARHYVIPEDQAVLLHLFPLDYADWKGKYDFRADSPALLADLPEPERNRYLTYSQHLSSDDPSKVLEYFFSLCVIDPALIPEMERLGYGFALQLDAAREAGLATRYRVNHEIAAQDLRA